MTKTDSSNLEKCQEMSKFYHSKFADIPSLSSQTYLENKHLENDDYLLVDVRSTAEQKVSMIPNAITLCEFEKRMKQKNDVSVMKKGNANNDNNDSLSTTTVVTYCTIGYRSGLEARRLRDEYDLHGKIYNLDGIVCYTHACNATLCKNNSNDDNSQVFLIDPQTKQSTMNVHVFGDAWNNVADPFQSVHFSRPVMILRGISVAFKGCINSCACCKRRTEREGTKHD